MALIVQQLRSFPSFAYQKMAERARSENADISGTIGSHQLLSIQSQSLTEELDTDETSIKPDRAR